MAGHVGYKKTAWDSATAPQRAVLRAALNELNLGVPVLIDDGSGVEWYVFHDSRIGQTFVENLAWFNSILPSILTSPERDYVVAEGTDPLGAAADAQGATPWFAAAQSLPDGWFPVDQGV